MKYMSITKYINCFTINKYTYFLDNKIQDNFQDKQNQFFIKRMFALKE